MTQSIISAKLKFYLATRDAKCNFQQNLRYNSLMETPPLKLKNPESSESLLAWNDIAEVETAKGSVYRYLPDGTTQRFKKVEGRDYEPQSALVYVPDYAWVLEHAPAHILERIGENEVIYTQILLEYIQNPRKEEKKVYITDSTGKVIETNQEIWTATGQVYLQFLTKGVTDFSIPVSCKPKIGFSTFDTRKYKDEKTNEWMRQRHLGNKVVKITLKK